MDRATIKVWRSQMFTAANQACSIKNACGGAMDLGADTQGLDAWAQAKHLHTLAAQAEAALDALRAALYEAQK